MSFFRKISIIFLLRCVKLTEIVTLYCSRSDFLLFNLLDNTEERNFVVSFMQTLRVVFRTRQCALLSTKVFLMFKYFIKCLPEYNYYLVYPPLLSMGTGKNPNPDNPPPLRPKPPSDQNPPPAKTPLLQNSSSGQNPPQTKSPLRQKKTILSTPSPLLDQKISSQVKTILHQV